MPDHLQSRTSDMHEGRGSRRRFTRTSVLIAVAIVATIAAILLLG